MRHYPLLLPPNSPLIAWPALMSGFQIQNFHSFHFHFQSYSWKSSGSFEQLHLLTDERSTKPWPGRSVATLRLNCDQFGRKTVGRFRPDVRRPRFADDHRDRFLALLVRGLDDPVGGGRNICLTTREGDQGCRNRARWCGRDNKSSGGTPSRSIFRICN